MNHIVPAVLTGSVALMISAAAWAQGNPASSVPATTEHPDAIVRMHQQVAVANRAYDKKVAAAKKVYDHKKAEAKKERDAAIKEAHGAAGS
ncbi:hypothetical protein OKW43_008211 [Paraburkholderia sp. WC7.3g]|uniref:Uncharacterized protein n=1 Tax=Paraburkholderia podalyriae TaxID=1938811 RepID=A0ABR7Q1P9_9BURK|nr:hypothetical protein [Paraburkholderia podalyriae]MBC8752454.1 hypothetical protein [Paraburkholderia podalyriae]